MPAQQPPSSAVGSDWLSDFPGTGSQVQTHLLPAIRRPRALAGRLTLMFSRLSTRDSDELPLRGPVQPSQVSLRALEPKKLVLERVDKDGNLHPQVFEGDTRAGWFVRDLLNRQK